MARKFSDLSSKDLSALPALTFDHSCIGQEVIFMHLYNNKGMNWYLAEYGPIGKRFFGFFENKADGLTSGQCGYEEISIWSKKGSEWEPLVDENWRPVAAMDIPILVEYIKMMILQPDLF